MKRFLIIALMACRLIPIKAQSAGTRAYTDSLQKRLAVTATDTGRAQLYFLLSDYWSDKDSSRAFSFIRSYFREGIHDNYYDGLAHFYLAGAWFDHDIPKSQQEYMTADRLLGACNNTAAILYRSRAWHNYGVLEQKKDNNRSFVDIQLSKAIPLALQARDTNRVAWDYKEVGEVFMNFDEYNKAYEYFRLALTFLHRPGADPEVMADCYINIAKAWLLQDNPAPARPALDSARLLLASLPLSSYQPARYWIEGMYFIHTRRWQQAIDSLDKGLTLARDLHRTYDVASMLFEKYRVYKQEKKFVDARKVLQEVYTWNLALPLSNNRRQILYELAETEAALGHMDTAYRWLRAYNQLADSMATAGTAVQIAALEARYRSAEKEKQILELHNRSRLQQLILLGGLIFLSIIILFLIYRFRQRKLQAEQQLQSLQQQQRIEVASALLHGEERERQRLARDLHDGLGGTLAGIKIKLSELVFSSVQEQDNLALQKIIRQLDSSVTELRHIAHNLMPESLVRSGLEVALTDLCESMSNGSTRVIFQMMNIASEIPRQTQLLIYRIVQELLANVLHHARASEVFVQCSQSENIFYITVEDDGIGFNKEQLTERKGIGWENIRRRVDFLKGKLEIESTHGKGTIVNIEINV